MIKNTFTITVASDGAVSLSDAIVMNKFESNVTKLSFSLPEMDGYTYLLVRHDRQNYFAIPIVNNIVMMGTTVTQHHGPWCFMVCITETEITKTDRFENAVFMSDVFDALVYDNISSADSPCGTEPNVIKLYNDSLEAYERFLKNVNDEISRENAYYTQITEEMTNQKKASESYAVGGTGTRTGEDTDNAKYYSEKAGQYISLEETLLESCQTSAANAAASAQTATVGAQNILTDGVPNSEIAFNTTEEAADQAISSITSGSMLKNLISHIKAFCVSAKQLIDNCVKKESIVQTNVNNEETVPSSALLYALNNSLTNDVSTLNSSLSSISNDRMLKTKRYFISKNNAQITLPTYQDCARITIFRDNNVVQYLCGSWNASTKIIDTITTGEYALTMTNKTPTITNTTPYGADIIYEYY